MAAASTITAAATAAYFNAQTHHVLSLTTKPSLHINIPVVSCPLPNYHGGSTKRQRKKALPLRIKNSPNDASSTADEAAIEVPKGPPSLISALNVEKALRGIAITDVDHYGRLGLPRKCSFDQVTDAYTKKIEEMKNRGLDEEELSTQSELLKESYSILSSAEERRLYDWSLARAGIPDRYVWPYEVDSSQTLISQEDPPSQEPEDIGPTRVTGYIFMAWLLLSFLLLVAFNI